MKKHLTILGVVLLSLAAVPQDKDKDKADKDKLQGTWVIEKLEIGGQEREEIKDLKITLTFKDDKMTIKLPDRDMEATFKIDSTKNPKTIDTTVKEGDEEVVRKGIFKLEGDTLTICRGDRDEDRPTEFKTKEGSRATLSVSKREKK